MNEYNEQFNNYHIGRKSNYFSKNIFIPFLSGIVGATLVVTICFTLLPKRNALTVNNQTSSSTASTTSVNANANYVSLSNYSDTSVEVAQKVLPCIVGIEVENNVASVFGNRGTVTGNGSGIIISNDGYILTNNHVVDSSNSNSSYYQISDASRINVYLYNDDTPYPAKIIGQDELTDIAVIKIDKQNLSPAILGNSDSLQVGEFAMVVGNPLGLQGSITCGNISAVSREITDSDGRKRVLIQTDAAINSGNSGGALVNSKGEVIGISTLKLSATGVEGLGFAIPINSVTDIYQQLIQYNKVKRPYIGISGIPINEKMSEYYKLPVGLYIKSIENFSPAEKSELKIGDVVLQVDGKEVKTIDDINEIKYSHNIGDSISFKIIRNGKEININVTLSEQP